MEKQKQEGFRNGDFNHFLEMLCGEFDNHEQVAAEITAGVQTHPIAKHIIGKCNDKIIHLPPDFSGCFVIEESYFDLGNQKIDKHYLFLYEMCPGNRVCLSSFNIPEHISKETFVNSNVELSMDYNAIELSPRFSPLILEKIGEKYEGRNTSVFSEAHIFKFKLEVTKDALYVKEVLEKEGVLVAGYYEPIIYKKSHPNTKGVA